MDTIDIIEKFKLFWQYPVITEKEFYQQNKDNDNYFGFPWATIIDKRYNLNVIYNILSQSIKDKKYYTCVQHISFRKIIPLLKALNITCVYTPHKVKGEDFIDTIQLKPCPLYAVNVEDKDRNKLFKNVEFEKIERPLLYSFQGAYDNRWYLTNIRDKIFNMKHPKNCFINRIGHWHFEHVVYSKMQNNSYILNENDSDMERTNKYNKLLLDSRFSLCPSGTGPNSIRFWESLAVGSIPVLLADTLELPEHKLWKDAIVVLLEKDIEQLDSILQSIDSEKEQTMRENCLKIYNDFRSDYSNLVMTKVFKIEIPTNLIPGYFSVFGHFFLDHLLQLYKICKWYNKVTSNSINSIYIENYDECLSKAPFIEKFYNSIFSKVHTESRYDYECIDLGIIMGSSFNSEIYNIYLALSRFKIDIPNEIVENGRKITDMNKNSINEMSKIIKNKLNITNDFIDKSVLIINRSKTRKLLNIDLIKNLFENKGYTIKTVEFEKLKLEEQISLVSSHEYIIAACGSVQVHISFMNMKSKYIELCESGFRYPNTAIYGYYFNIDTKNLCIPLDVSIRNKYFHNTVIKELFEKGDKMPEIILPTVIDINREKEFYINLLGNNCFFIHNCQNIDCKRYLDSLQKIL